MVDIKVPEGSSVTWGVSGSLVCVVRFAHFLLFCKATHNPQTKFYYHKYLTLPNHFVYFDNDER